MARFARKKKTEVGLSPDSLLFRGERKMETPLISVFTYSEGTSEESTLSEIDELVPYLQVSDKIVWVNIDGIHDETMMKRLGELCRLENSTLSDIMDSGFRASVKELDEYVFMSLKMLRFNDESVIGEQLSLLLGESLVISFQEQPGDVFEPVRERIRKKRRIAGRSANFLTFSLIDVVIDTYLLIISELGDRIEELDEALTEHSSRELLGRIYQYKKELNYLRKTIFPTREMVQQLLKTDNDLLTPESGNGGYYQELVSNCSLAVEGVESYREILNDQFSLYHTEVSGKLNDIMKVLTIFSAIFIPLTFIAGIYGTNFDYIPELAFRYAYFIMLGVMAVVAFVMILFFRSRKWFGKS